MSGKYITDYRQDMRLVKSVPQRLVMAIGILSALALPFILQIDWDPPLDFPADLFDSGHPLVDG